MTRHVVTFFAITQAVVGIFEFFQRILKDDSADMIWSQILAGSTLKCPKTGVKLKNDIRDMSRPPTKYFRVAKIDACGQNFGILKTAKISH